MNLSGTESYKSNLELSDHIISPGTSKILVSASCPICKKPGMAYEDPLSNDHKPHFCIKHNPLTVN